MKIDRMKTYVVIISALVAVSTAWSDSTFRAANGLEIYAKFRNGEDVNFRGGYRQTILTERCQYTTDDDPIGDDDE